MCFQRSPKSPVKKHRLTLLDEHILYVHTHTHTQLGRIIVAELGDLKGVDEYEDILILVRSCGRKDRKRKNTLYLK